MDESKNDFDDTQFDSHRNPDVPFDAVGHRPFERGILSFEASFLNSLDNEVEDIAESEALENEE